MAISKEFKEEVSDIIEKYAEIDVKENREDYDTEMTADEIKSMIRTSSFDHSSMLEEISKKLSRKLSTWEEQYIKSEFEESIPPNIAHFKKHVWA